MLYVGGIIIKFISLLDSSILFSYGHISSNVLPFSLVCLENFHLFTTTSVTESNIYAL
tara:strand:- start:6 stop:179 length:174 start_codon:yes stop_codon:yes gene_type:complete